MRIPTRISLKVGMFGSAILMIDVGVGVWIILLAGGDGQTFFDDDAKTANPKTDSKVKKCRMVQKVIECNQGSSLESRETVLEPSFSFFKT